MKNKLWWTRRGQCLRVKKARVVRVAEQVEGLVLLWPVGCQKSGTRGRLFAPLTRSGMEHETIDGF